MKTQHTIDALFPSGEHNDTTRRDTIEQDRRYRWTSFIVGVLVGFHALTEKSLAAVEWHKDQQTGAVECVQKDEQTGKQTKLHFGSHKEIGTYPSLERIESPFVQALKKVDVKMPYVNEHIQDPVAWEKFVWSEAEGLGFSYDKRGTLTAQEAIELAIKVVKKNLRFEKELLNDRAPLTAEIDATPIDKVIMDKHIGVCRHFSVGEDKVYEIFSDDPECRMLSNTFMRRLITNDGYHAINLVGDIHEEGKDGVTITLTSIDTSVGRKIINVGSIYLDDFKIKTYESADQQKDALYPFYTQYLEPIFDKGEQLDSKKYVFEQTSLAGYDTLAHTIELAFSYLGAIEDTAKKGRIADEQSIFAGFRNFVKNHKEDLERDPQKDEYELLYSVFYNVYKVHANAQKDPVERVKIEHEGQAMRLQSFQTRYDALMKAGEVHKALRVGEDSADILGRTGDTAGAEKFYRQLFTTYQDHKTDVGVYERSMPRDDSEFALFVKIEPFKDEASLQKYLNYKKRLWNQK